jgi:hypothetical protein
VLARVDEVIDSAVPAGPFWVKRYRSHSATLQAKSEMIQKLT